MIWAKLAASLLLTVINLVAAMVIGVLYTAVCELVQPDQTTWELSGGNVAGFFITSSLAMLGGFAIEIGVVPKDASAGLNYGLDKVRFMTAVKAGARVRSRVTLVSAESKGGGRVLIKIMNELQIDGEDKPALIAETLAMLVA